MVLRLDICLSTFFRSNSYRIPKYYLETTKRKNDKQSNNQIAKKYSKQLNFIDSLPKCIHWSMIEIYISLIPPINSWTLTIEINKEESSETPYLKGWF